jgi:hypothetical protein
VTGTYSVAIGNSAFNRLYVATYSIFAADTWETKTVTIAGDTSGTWLTDSGIGLRLYFDLGSGSDYNASSADAWLGSGVGIRTSGSVNWIATSGATFYITGVQLEKGSVATEFERRPYGTELALCQRYYQRYTRIDLYPTNNDFSKRRFYVPRTVTMRATPTEAGTQGAGGTTAFYGAASNVGMDVDGATASAASECSNYTASAEL